MMRLTVRLKAENLNHHTLTRGQKFYYQVWLDTTKFTEANNIQYVGVSDTYDADKLNVNASDIKAYDSVTGADVTAKFDIKVENGTITATSKEAFIKDKKTTLLSILLSSPLDVTINLISQQLLKILKTMTVLSLVIRPMKLFINTTLTISKLQLLKNQLKHVKITFQFHLSSTILRNLKDVS